MQLGRLPRTYRSIRRYQRIMSVFLKYGFDDIIERLNLAGKNPLPFLRRESELRGLSTARRFTMALEELGPTFIKFGQMLSTRPDLLPPEFIAELRKLQDEVPPMPPREVRRVVESELRADVEDIFAHFDFEAHAAASIAQVHLAALKDGTEVVVKVQRPEAPRLIAADTEVLFHVAGLMERHAVGERFDPVGTVRQFQKNIRRELDFTLEGQNIDRFRAHFDGFSSEFYVPRVFWEHSGPKLLILERIHGIKVSERERLVEEGIDPDLVAERVLRVLLRQMLEFGLFHADPHPGNIFVLPGGVVCFLDYGLVGRLDDDLIGQMIAFGAAVWRRDVDSLVRVLTSIGVVEEDVNIRALKLDLLDLVDRFADLPLGRIDLQAIFEQFIGVIRQHRIGVPAEFLLLGRAAILMQSVVRSLSPGMAPLQRMGPYLEEIARKRVTLERISRDWRRSGIEFADFIRELPGDMRGFFRKVQRNRLVVNFEHRGLEHFIDEMDRSSNRIAFALVIAALIVSSAIIMQTRIGPLLWGFPVLGIIGFMAAGVLGFGLALAILRSGKL